MEHMGFGVSNNFGQIQAHIILLIKSFQFHTKSQVKLSKYHIFLLITYVPALIPSNIPMIEGSLEVKLPTIWTDEKQSREEAERRERLEERRVEEKELEERKIRRKKSRRERVRRKKLQILCFSNDLWLGSKSRLAKAAGAEPAGQMSDEKLHAVVTRSTFRSQNVQNTPLSDHFWQLRCRKSARRCGAKHISKSKCTKHTILGPLLEVEMSKKCTPLWREPHLEVKMYKTPQCRTTFGSWDVEKVHALVARTTFGSQNVKNTWGSDHFWKFRSRKSARRCGAKHIFEVKMLKTLGVRTTFGGSDVASLHYTILHYTTLHYTTVHYTTLHSTTLQVQLHNYTPLHSNTLNYTTLHYTTLHSTTLLYITLHYLPLHFTTLHYTTLHYNYNYTTTLHYTPLH